MEITNVMIKLNEKKDEKLKAYVKVELNNCFVINSIRIIEGSQRLFVAMPSVKTSDNKFMDVCHPITSDFRQELEKEIINKYNLELTEEGVEC